MSLWGALLLGLIGAGVGRYLFVTSPSPASAFSESANAVVVQQQKRSAVVALLLILAPWLLTGRALRDPEPTGTMAIFAVIIVGSSIGGVVLILALRKVVVDRDGLRVRSTISYRFAWDELRNIEATDHGSIAVAKFDFGRKKVTVDSNMDGFRQLVRALEVWPTGNAKPIAERAARVLANWRNDPDHKA